MNLTNILLGITTALAEAGDAAGDAAVATEEMSGAAGVVSLLVSLLPMILIFVVFYFFLIRPQQKRQKEHMQMCEGLTRGDEVTTLGGISGRIESVDEQTIGLQVASVDGKPVVIRMQRTSVSVVLPKGTLKI